MGLFVLGARSEPGELLIDGFAARLPGLALGVRLLESVLVLAVLDGRQDLRSLLLERLVHS